MNDETVWVSRSVRAWEIFSAVAVADIASILFISFFFLISWISRPWVFSSMVFEG